MGSIKVLVDIDAILDTRLGIAEQLQPGLALELLANGWNTRTQDKLIWEIGNMSETTYKEAYGRRDHTVLPLSIRTSLMKFIASELHELIFTEDVEKGDIHHSVHVNCFPYRLSKGEAEELKQVVFAMVPMVREIDLVEVDYRNLSTGYLASNSYTHYYTYEINRWLKMHAAEAIKVPAPRISVIGPEVRENELDDLTDKEKELANTISPWEAMEQSFGLYLMLRYIEMRYFCLDSLN